MGSGLRRTPFPPRFIRRCWRRQDCADHGADQQRGQSSRRLLGVCWSRGANPGGQRLVPRDDRVRGHQPERRHFQGARGLQGATGGPNGAAPVLTLGSATPPGRPGLWADERAPGRPRQSGSDWTDGGRVLQGPGGSGRAALHRQHLPLHPGWLRGWCWSPGSRGWGGPGPSPAAGPDPSLWAPPGLSAAPFPPRCQPCWGESPPLWATSPRWPPTWAPCRSGSPPRARAPSPQCR